MAEASTTYHESADELSAKTKDHHRAIVSLQEELEAVDWYDQRIEAATDDELREILAHNREEEKEHAAMVLEWLRRHDTGFEAELGERLFTSGPIVTEEDKEEEARRQTDSGGSKDDNAGATPADGSLGIGSLKGAL